MSKLIYSDYWEALAALAGKSDMTNWTLINRGDGFYEIIRGRRTLWAGDLFCSHSTAAQWQRQRRTA